MAAPKAAAALKSEWRALLVLLGLALGVMALSQWWGQRQSQAQGRQLAALVQAGDLRMISSVTCPYCTKAREYFKRHGVPFDECFIERSPACAADYQATLGLGTPTLLVRGQVQVGFLPEKVIARMQAPR